MSDGARNDLATLSFTKLTTMGEDSCRTNELELNVREFSLIAGKGIRGTPVKGTVIDA